MDIRYITIVGKLEDFPAKEDVEVGDRLVLKIDPANKDPFAIAVYNMDEEKVGYVSARTETTLPGCLKNREIYNICKESLVIAEVEEIIQRPDTTVFKAFIEYNEEDEYEEYPGEDEGEIDIAKVMDQFFSDTDKANMTEIAICDVLVRALLKAPGKTITYTGPSGTYTLKLTD